MLLPDWIVGLPYKRILQLWVERVSVRPGDIAFVIGRSELNLAIGGMAPAAGVGFVPVTLISSGPALTSIANGPYV